MSTERGTRLPPADLHGSDSIPATAGRPEVPALPGVEGGDPQLNLAPTSGHRKDVQGLRGLAVLLVVLYHAGLPVRGGYFGVDVFFVISG